MSEPISFSGPPVCVVGNVNRDVKLLRVPASPALFQDGETSVPAVTETIGGGGANSACAAAALGAKVHFVAKTGDDALAAQLQAAMEKFGVQTFFARDRRCQTGATAALNFTNGHRHFLSCLPNNESVVFEDLNLAALDGCAHLLRADVWFSRQMLEDGNRRLFGEAKRRGIATSVDINFDPKWSSGAGEEISRRKKLLQQTLDLVDLAHGNIRELCEFADCGDLDVALKRLTDWGVKAVVVHMGAQGAGYYTNGNLIVEPADPAQRVINSTGSGDILSMCMILLHARRDLSAPQKLAVSNRIVREYIEGERTVIPTL
ncbi:MAG TPA: carbohydrate kinase family protein [Verrucomicrobiae bacterium]